MGKNELVEGILPISSRHLFEHLSISAMRIPFFDRQGMAVRLVLSKGERGTMRAATRFVLFAMKGQMSKFWTSRLIEITNIDQYKEVNNEQYIFE